MCLSLDADLHMNVLVTSLPQASNSVIYIMCQNGVGMHPISNYYMNIFLVNKAIVDYLTSNYYYVTKQYYYVTKSYYYVTKYFTECVICYIIYY